MSKVIFSITEVQADALRAAAAGFPASVEIRTIDTLIKRGLLTETTPAGLTYAGLACLNLLNALAQSEGHPL